MSNPLLAFWHLLFAHRDDDPRRHRLRQAVPQASAAQASATIFLVLRRMRAPLIVLIVIFAISVLGLSMIPGRTELGQPWRMTFFDAFYFMSYTATTIGFGEIPHEFTYPQRMWVTFSIYLTVIGWAYAIGSLLSLLQDRGFRDALDLRRFSSKVSHLREPFLLVAGYGQTGRLLGHALDTRGRRFVVLDSSESSIERLDLDTHVADVPGLVGDARDPAHLAVAGLDHPYCEGVVAITNDDEVNLAVTMTTALLRPDLPVITRTSSRAYARRMCDFGAPVVINPFDRFGDRLALALRAPSAYRLLAWLTSTADEGPPPLRTSPPRGRWVVCGYGRFGWEITADLRNEGFDVAVVETHETPREEPGEDPTADEDRLLADADIGTAVGFVAATSNDTMNLSLLAAARRANPSLFLVARENHAGNAALYEAIRVDSRLVPADMVAREALARLGHPLLWDLLVDVPAMADDRAGRLVDHLAQVCGDRAPHLWDLQVSDSETPILTARGGVRIGDLLRDPEDRDQRLDAVPLLLLRREERRIWPDDDEELGDGDEVLLAGTPTARHVFERTLLTDAALEYVVSGRRVPTGWLWRRLSGTGERREERVR